MPVLKPILTGSLLLSCLVLTACVPPAPPGPGPDRFVVQPVTLDHTIRFAAGDLERLNATELDRLRVFLEEIDADRSGVITLESDAAEPALYRRAAVWDLVESTGRRLDGVADRAISPDLVTIRIRHELIVPSACLEANGWPTPEDLPAGCINDFNLLAMAEINSDLTEGRTLGLAPSAPGGDLIRNYLRRFRGDNGPDIDEIASPPPLSPSTLFVE
ncbi:MAG: hypothetical protein AAGA73_00365 [Pseudomonadota bacterium]